MAKSDVFDLLGMALLALFAYSIWPAAALLVAATACLIAGRAAHK